MFGFLKGLPAPDPLETAKEKLRSLVSLHLKTLAIKRHAGATVDAYGTPDGTKWIAEAQYFVDKVWAPLLTIDEKKAVLAAGISEIAQQLIENPVRAECRRMHATGERDMTVATYHPPDAAATQAAGAKGLSRLRDAVPGVGEITRGLIIREEPLEQILSGRKTWEMRSDLTRIRGRVALIRKASKAIFGIAEIADCKGPLTNAELLATVHLHGISHARLQSGEVANYRYAWVLGGVRRLRSPVPYHHKGGVKFVTLDDYAVSALALSLRAGGA